MRLCRAVRSVPSRRAAPATFQSVSSSARRMRSRSAACRTSCRPAAGPLRRRHPHFQRHDVRRDAIAGRQDRHALDDVAELADVAGPGVALEQRASDVGVDRARPDVVAGAELRQEVGHERPDVLRPLAQRRHADRKPAQAVEEILAERCRSRRARRAHGWSPRSPGPRRGFGCSPPSRCTSPSCSTRSDFACDDSCRSPTSLEERSCRRRPELEAAAAQAPPRR